jgi:hypothetical protein
MLREEALAKLPLDSAMAKGQGDPRAARVVRETMSEPSDSNQVPMEGRNRCRGRVAPARSHIKERTR